MRSECRSECQNDTHSTFLIHIADSQAVFSQFWIRGQPTFFVSDSEVPLHLFLLDFLVFSFSLVSI